MTMATEAPTSPRIEALKAAIATGDGDALPAFWRQVEAEGAPIVEPLPGDGEHLLLTFVYRATEPLTNITIVPGIGRFYDLAYHQLSLIEGTDLWHRTYRVRRDLRATYHFSPNDPLVRPFELEEDEQVAYLAGRVAAWRTDPLNPNTASFEPGPPAQSFVEMPDAPAQPYVEKVPGVPEGTIEREDLAADHAGEARRVWTYLPSGYAPSKGPYPVVLQFDGIISRRLGLHTTLDNMITAGIIPPVVAVMLHNRDRMSELSNSPEFTDWLATCFLPEWRDRHAITDDPTKTVVTGMSLGGLASAYCGLRHPGVFGNVLSQSGSFWWPETRGATSGWEWLTRQYEASPKLPVRFYMDVGLLEDGRRDLPGYPTMVEANRHLRDVLIGKGYDVHYAEFNGGHDYLSWRGTIADGLRALLGSPD